MNFDASGEFGETYMCIFMGKEKYQVFLQIVNSPKLRSKCNCLLNNTFIVELLSTLMNILNSLKSKCGCLVYKLNGAGRAISVLGMLFRIRTQRVNKSS